MNTYNCVICGKLLHHDGKTLAFWFTDFCGVKNVLCSDKCVKEYFGPPEVDNFNDDPPEPL